MATQEPPKRMGQQCLFGCGLYREGLGVAVTAFCYVTNRHMGLFRPCNADTGKGVERAMPTYANVNSLLSRRGRSNQVLKFRVQGAQIP